MIIDTHCHLDYFDKSELETILANAHGSGVGKMITIGTKIDGSADALSIAKAFAGRIFVSIGQHPCNVDSISPDALRLMSSAIEDNRGVVVAVGETGLDYYHSQDEKHLAMQKESFAMHIDVATKYDLPLVIHSRNSDEDVGDILSVAAKALGARGVIHCFTGSESFMRQMLDAGFFISLSGIVTFKNAKYLHDIAKMIPLERLLIETDSPYLAPVPHRGKRNEPAFIKHVADFLADHIGIARDELVSITTKNANNLFRLGD